MANKKNSEVTETETNVKEEEVVDKVGGIICPTNGGKFQVVEIRTSGYRHTSIDRAREEHDKVAFISFSVYKNETNPLKGVAYELDDGVLKVDIDATVSGKYNKDAAKLGLHAFLTDKEAKKLFDTLYVLDMADSDLAPTTIEGFDSVELAVYAATVSPKIDVIVENVVVKQWPKAEASNIFTVSLDDDKKSKKKKDKKKAKKKGKKKKK